jgi:hypothetical protein
VFPQPGVVAVTGFPVSVDVVQQIGLTGGRQRRLCTRVGARRVAVGFIGAVAVVGPEAVDCPGIVGAGGGGTVPELHAIVNMPIASERRCWPHLCLQYLAAGIVETARVCDRGGIATAQGGD